MKVLLKEPIEGFELEAEYRFACSGEWIVNNIETGEPRRMSNESYGSASLVLTPKKKKYWRLDCCPFEAATKPERESSMKSALAFDEHGNVIWCYEDCLSDKGKWLRLTEHEE